MESFVRGAESWAKELGAAVSKNNSVANSICFRTARLRSMIPMKFSFRRVRIAGSNWDIHFLSAPGRLALTTSMEPLAYRTPEHSPTLPLFASGSRSTGDSAGFVSQRVVSAAPPVCNSVRAQPGFPQDRRIRIYKALARSYPASERRDPQNNWAGPVQGSLPVRLEIFAAEHLPSRISPRGPW